MLPDKRTAALRDVLARSDAADKLAVVIEVERNGVVPDPPDPPGSTRAEKVSRRREAFHEAAEPVTKAVADAGGTIDAELWINGTLHAQLPVSGVEDVERLDAVRVLDVPGQVAQTG